MIKRLQGNFLIVVFFALFLLAGCYHATIDTGLAPGHKTVEMWKHSWIYGLVPPSVVEAQSECENGVARVETQQSFINGLVGILTSGIYTPMTVIVTCAAADMSSAAVDSASVVTVPYGSDDEEIMDAFGQAADKAVAADQPAYVQFADRTPSSKPTDKKMSLHDAAEAGILDRVRFLVEDGANVNAHNEQGNMPLYKAAGGGHLEVVRFLVANGASVNARSIWVENGADVNARNTLDIEGSTPLHKAAGGGHLEVVRFLVANGASVNARNILNTTPLEWAAGGGHLEVVRFLVENGADDLNGALEWAAGGGHLEVVRFLVENGADDLNGALGWYAAGGGHLEVVRFLVANGASVNARDKFGNTPLHIAVAPISSVLDFEGHLEVARFLVGNGANVNARKENGATPLHGAAFCEECLEAVRLLIENGADVNARDKGDRTPLHTAASKGYLKVVRFLVENGADVNARGPDRRTPLRMATDEEVANYLRSQGGTK